MGQEIPKKANLEVIQQEQLFDCEQFPVYDLILKDQGLLQLKVFYQILCGII
ncbi:MAG: hypothetical protein ACFFKA_16335 [Candidatus Thorarchaeota archaeon]